MSDNTIERGDSFEAHSDPATDEMVVLATGHLSGYKAALVAERSTRTGEWSAHWLKATYIHDEVNLGATESTGTMDEDRLQSLEMRLRSDVPDVPSSPEGVTPAASLD